MYQAYYFKTSHNSSYTFLEMSLKLCLPIHFVLYLTSFSAFFWVVRNLGGHLRILPFSLFFVFLFFERFQKKRGNEKGNSQVDSALISQSEIRNGAKTELGTQPTEATQAPLPP